MCVCVLMHTRSESQNPDIWPQAPWEPLAPRASDAGLPPVLYPFITIFLQFLLLGLERWWVDDGKPMGPLSRDLHPG